MILLDLVVRPVLRRRVGCRGHAVVEPGLDSTVDLALEVLNFAVILDDGVGEIRRVLICGILGSLSRLLSGLGRLGGGG